MMLRILQVVTDMGRGGLETMLMNYYRNIDRTKIQFDFLVHRNNREAYDDEIELLGGKIFRVPRLNPFSYKYKSVLKEFFCSHREYQIIHVHQDCMSSVILKIAEECGVPVRIAHSHNSNQNRDLKYPIKLYYKRFISQYATDLFACSEEAGKWMFSGAKFKVLNNAIDAKSYKFNDKIREEMRVQLGIEKNELVIGHVGRFSEVKNHKFLVEIFYRIQKENSAKLLLIGEGVLQEKVKEQAKNLGIEKQVLFLGMRSDVQRLLQAMDVLVFPSLYEGLPLSLIEAQAAGLPCIISNKVPIECKKTDLVQQLDLAENTLRWADCILKASMQERRNTYQEIKEAGFDIIENAKYLEKYYKMKAVK